MFYGLSIYPNRLRLNKYTIPVGFMQTDSVNRPPFFVSCSIPAESEQSSGSDILQQPAAYSVCCTGFRKKKKKTGPAVDRPDPAPRQ